MSLTTHSGLAVLGLKALDLDQVGGSSPALGWVTSHVPHSSFSFLPDRIKRLITLAGGSGGWSIVLYTRRLWDRSLVRSLSKVVGSIPSRGTYGRQPIDVSLSLKSINVSSGKD